MFVYSFWCYGYVHGGFVRTSTSTYEYMVEYSYSYSYSHYRYSKELHSNHYYGAIKNIDYNRCVVRTVSRVPSSVLSLLGMAYGSYNSSKR